MDRPSLLDRRATGACCDRPDLALIDGVTICKTCGLVHEAVERPAIARATPVERLPMAMFEQRVTRMKTTRPRSPGAAASRSSGHEGTGVNRKPTPAASAPPGRAKPSPSRTDPTMTPRARALLDMPPPRASPDGDPVIADILQYLFPGQPLIRWIGNKTEIPGYPQRAGATRKP